MSEAGEKYVLDANVFIQAKRRFYDFDFCPGYWRVLIYYNREGRLSSIDRVQEELKRGGDDTFGTGQNSNSVPTRLPILRRRLLRRSTSKC